MFTWHFDYYKRKPFQVIAPSFHGKHCVLGFYPKGNKTGKLNIKIKKKRFQTLISLDKSSAFIYHVPFILL
jgi:hypothetical protein